MVPSLVHKHVFFCYAALWVATTVEALWTPSSQPSEQPSSQPSQQPLGLRLGNIVRIAGTYGASGAGTGDGGPATAATFNWLQSVTVDSAHNKVYVADRRELVVRQIDLSTGIMSTLPLSGATFTNIETVRYASTGDLYIPTDTDTSPSLYKYSYPFTSAPTTYPFTRVESVAVDASGNFYYNNVVQGSIYLYNPSTASSTFIFSMYYPRGLTLHPFGAYLYFGGCESETIVQYTVATASATVIAGQQGSMGTSASGIPATSGRLSYPTKTAVDSSGNVFICDQGTGVIRYVQASTGIMYTVAGSSSGVFGSTGDGGAATSALFGGVLGIDIALDEANDRLYVADNSNKVVRVIAIPFHPYTPTYIPTMEPSSPSSQPTEQPTSHPSLRPLGLRLGNIFRFAGTYGLGGWTASVPGTGDGGPATAATFNHLYDVTVDLTHNKVYAADTGDASVRQIDLSTGIISTVPLGSVTFHGIEAIRYVTSSGDLYIATNTDSAPSLYKYTYPFTSAPATYPFTRTESVAVDASGNFYYTNVVAATVQLYHPDTSSSTFVLSMYPTGYPRGLSLDPTGTYLYFGGSESAQLHQYTIATGNLVALAGYSRQQGVSASGIPATSGHLNYPTRTVVDSSGNIFFADQGNSVIRYIHKSTGIMYTVAGSSTGVVGSTGDGGASTSALLGGTWNNFALDEANDRLYIADFLNKVRPV